MVEVSESFQGVQRCCTAVDGSLQIVFGRLQEMPPHAQAVGTLHIEELHEPGCSVKLACPQLWRHCCRTHLAFCDQL